MAAMPGSLLPLVSMTGPQLAHQQMLNSSLLVRAFGGQGLVAVVVVIL